MSEFFSRSEVLLGEKVMHELQNKRVILFGVGGVGSWCAEALVRTGLTHLTIVDGDVVQESNVNRQLPATRETIGLPKVEALKARLLTINPEAEITAIHAMYKPTPAPAFSQYDFVIDAIDSVNDSVKIFSSMGAALRLDPTQVTTGELMSIKGDALAKAVRARMKKLDLHPYKKVRCVYSTEQAQRCEARGSLMQVTAVFGCTLASMVIEDIRKNG